MGDEVRCGVAGREGHPVEREQHGAHPRLERGVRREQPYLAQVGSTALPGTEPSGTSTAKVQDYVSVNDTACFISYFNVTTWSRAYVTLSRNSVGLDPRVPARAHRASGQHREPATVYNAFTLSAGALRELTIPRTGGWTVQSTVTFTDGSVLSGTQSIPVHPVPTCLGPPIRVLADWPRGVAAIGRHPRPAG